MKWMLAVALAGAVVILSFVNKSDSYCSKCPGKELAFCSKCPGTPNQNRPLLDFCKKATSDEKTFAAFKQDPIYKLFYENTSIEEANACLQSLRLNAPELLEPKVLAKLHEADLFGSPSMYAFDSIGEFSPTTLHYLKVAAELKSHFGDLKNIRLLQIGGGSGGLCKVLKDLFEIEQYTIVDHAETLGLIKKHLEAHHVQKVEFFSPLEIKDGSFDLVISEGIASLINPEIKSLLSKVSKGYLIGDFEEDNFLSNTELQKELFKKI